jgi:hypothetical protein
VIAILLDQVNINIEPTGSSPDQIEGYTVTIMDPQSGIMVKLPLNAADAHSIGAILQGKPAVQVARQMPNGPVLPPR